MRKLIKASTGTTDASNVRNLSIGSIVTGIKDDDGNVWTATINNITMSYDLQGKDSSTLYYTLRNEGTGKKFDESNSAVAFYKHYISNEW